MRALVKLTSQETSDLPVRSLVLATHLGQGGNLDGAVYCASCFITCCCLMKSECRFVPHVTQAEFFFSFPVVQALPS